MQSIDIFEGSIDLYSKIYDNTNDSIFITDEDNNIVHINKACEELTGYTLNEVKGLNPKIFAKDIVNNDSLETIMEEINKKSYWNGEFLNRHKNGTIYSVFIKIFKYEELQTKNINYISILSNPLLSEDSKKYTNFTEDVLTSLANKTKLQAQLEYVIDNSKRNSLKFAVLYLDLDNFKTINEELGYSYGDEVLISFSNKFRNAIRTNDIISRVGSDSFIIVLSDINDYLFVERVCKRILSLSNKPIALRDGEISLGVSIGVSIFPDNAQSLEKLIENADIAMYHTKRHGKNNFEFYSQWMNDKLSEQNLIEKRLKRALENDEFIIHLQPEIDLSNNEVFSLEVLSRWNSIDNGILLPKEFIEDLESTKLIFEFEKLILKKACKQLKLWQDSNFYEGTISVNISGLHLEYGDILESVKSALINSQLDAKYLELEFHEADIMKVSSNTIITLSELSNLGVGLSIDNFGVGFSSFNYLRQCSISKLKIDKSYIDSLLEEKSDEDIIKSIVDLGTNMGISIIAEGIEVSKQDEIIKNNLCSKVQGYFYARPMLVEHFESWYKKFRLLNTLS